MSTKIKFKFYTQEVQLAGSSQSPPHRDWRVSRHFNDFHTPGEVSLAAYFAQFFPGPAVH